MNLIIFEVIGWAGAILILLAYFLVSFQKITSNSSIYQILNLFGAGAVFLNVFVHQAFPAAALNFAWFVIALVALTKRAKF